MVRHQGTDAGLHRAQKFFYCPLKGNRKVDDSGGKPPYTAVSELHWSGQDSANENFIKMHGFSGPLKVKLFRVATTNNCTEWVVINDIDKVSTAETRTMCAIGRRIEQFRREVKQTLGIAKCRYRSEKFQRNHIDCAIWAWNHLTMITRNLTTNIYASKKKCWPIT